jgi:mannitol/fructose-specific phosphotransferase system IIA component (Ntr-type)
VLKDREKSYGGMGTGIGFGLAHPHALTGAISQPVVALGRSKRGLEWNALDNQPVHVVFLFLLPPGDLLKHRSTSGTIAKFLHRKEVRQALDQAPDADTILRAIKYFEES